MLLGFVNKALDYLNKHIGEDQKGPVTELQNIDLESLKKELGEELKEVSAKLTTTAEDLMAAGYEAFDKFVNANKKEEKKEDLVKEFDELFDVDLDEEEKKVPADSKEELQDLLSFYDLDSDIQVEDVKEDEPVEEETEELASQTPSSDIEKAASEVEEEIPYELDEEETQMLELIARNVNRKDGSRSQEVLAGANKELDSIFSELVAAENVKEEKESEYRPSMINQIQELGVVSDPALEDVPVQEETKEEVIDEIPEEERIRIIENPLVDVSMEQEREKEEEIEKEIERQEEEERSHLVFPEQVDKDDIIKLMKDIQPLSDVYYNKIENFISEQENAEREAAEEVHEAIEEPKKADDSYISSLIDDLKSRLDEEEIEKRRQEEQFKEIYDKIHKAYPYLSGGFIRNVYDLKESIAEEYPLGVEIVILHRTSFKNVENLRQYVEITLNHGYAINADEKQMIVDAFKQHINTDGKIITSIFEVANQSALLSGEYEGYRVLFEEDLK